MSGHPQTSKLQVIGICLAGLILFAGLVAFMYQLAGKLQTFEDARAIQRVKDLGELKTEYQKDLAGGQWIEQTNGIVSLPVDRAMELTVQELRLKPLKTAGKAEPAPSNVTPPPPATPTP